MKKSNISFIENQLQSKWAIIFIVLRFLQKLIVQLWPIFLALFLGGSGRSGFEKYEIIGASVGIFGMFTSIVAYFRYFYRVSHDELIIEKGIFKKIRLNLPFERIQSINFHQNFLHQILNVTAVEIESAGSEQKELKIDALRIEVAEELRKILLEKKASHRQPSNTLIYETEEFRPTTEKINILDLNLPQLIKVGLLQNHLKPIGLLFSLGGSAFAYGYTIGMDPMEIINYARRNLFNLNFDEYALWIPLFIPLMILYSIVTTILRHYNLNFSRSGQRFHVVQGLINKQQFSALDRKIQIMSWSQNPLERLIGLFRIYFQQARSGNGKEEKMRFDIPGLSHSDIDEVKNHWLGLGRGNFENKFGVSIHFFKRSAIYQCLFYGLILVLLIYFCPLRWIILWVIWWSFSLFLTWQEYKKKRFAINANEVYVGGGRLGFKNSIFPVHKIQNIRINQNPYQWRRGLGSLILYTSAGRVKIPYIKIEKAEELMDLLIYKVERSKKSWM